MTHLPIRMNPGRATAPILVASLWLLTAAPPPIVAQSEQQLPTTDGVQPDATLIVDQAVGQRVRMAVPAAKYQTVFPPAARRAAEELEQTLLDDLEFSGVFSLQTAEQLQVLELTGERDQDFELYRSLGNNVVLLMDLSLDAENKITLEGRVFDLAGRSMILGKRYRGSFDIARRVAHTMNDEIILYFTGQRGIGLTSVAFTSDRDGVGNKELYIMDYDGFDQRRITGHESLTFTPAWSPDGSGLAYTSYYELTPSLYWADRDTGKKSRILVDDTQTMSPDVSPDGQWIAFARSVRGNVEIFRCRVTSCEASMQRLTTSGAIDTNPAWSPDGRQIAFTSSRGGSPQIYVMRADGSDVKRITFEGRYNEGADWSPDGSRIVFAHRTPDGRRFDVAQVEIATGDQRILTNGPGSHESPTFSPDGRFIAYESDRTGNKQIFLMTADGRPVRQLTRRGQNFDPSWSGYLY